MSFLSQSLAFWTLNILLNPDLSMTGSIERCLIPKRPSFRKIPATDLLGDIPLFLLNSK